MHIYCQKQVIKCIYKSHSLIMCLAFSGPHVTSICYIDIYYHEILRSCHTVKYMTNVTHTCSFKVFILFYSWYSYYNGISLSGKYDITYMFSFDSISMLYIICLFLHMDKFIMWKSDLKAPSLIPVKKASFSSVVCHLSFLISSTSVPAISLILLFW